MLIVQLVIAQPVLSTKSKKAIEFYTEADNYRVRGQYSQALQLLKQAVEKDKNFAEAYYRMGIIYMSQRNFQLAATSFETGLNLTADVKKQKVFWYDLGETYFALGEYEKADEFAGNFLAAETANKPKIDKARNLKNNIDFVKKNKANAALYQQRVLSDTVNQFAMQYFPVLTADQQELIFTRRQGFTDDFDEDLVFTRKNENGQWISPQSISGNINSIYNEGTCTISADGRKLIFTSCIGREGFGSCDLFQSLKIGDEWTNPQNLGSNVNSSEWESQPSLSADGRTIYFVSDRRGGLGRRDIWMSTLDGKGNWTRAKNIGKPVNTVYDELSPFIHVNNKTLFFASNGLVGFGGYDLYSAEKDSVLTWTNPVNVGAPINNHEDQFSLFITADGKKGYYSHEEIKAGGNARSKIIEINIPEEKRVRFRSNYVKGRVTDHATKLPLRAAVELVGIEKNETESLVESDSLTGEYLIVLTQGAEYALYINKKEYLFKSLNFNYSTVKDFEPIILNIELDRVQQGSSAVLENIFFDTDKYDLKPKSLSELEKLKRFLTDNPTVRMEISGHTDNTGSSTYNYQLSEKRALAVHNYLTQQGISPKRLVVKGYGPDKPLADNTTESGKRLNRRIEFKLIK
jgi:outer membrane protein OmpA-like peptidoglycan-associated protein/tetratricopeptide (TPR) repeat protein